MKGRRRLARMQSWLLALGIAAALAVGITACGGGLSINGNGGAGQIIVGLITKTDTNPYFVKMKQAAQKAAKENNVMLLTAAGMSDADNASQVTALENMTTQGAKGILITPADSKAVVPAIKKARDAGVIVISLDTPTEPQSAVDALFATDNLKAGELIGEYAKAKFAGKPAKIALLDLAPGISVGLLRHQGFLKGFGIKEGDPQIVGAADTLGVVAKGQAAMEQLLQKDPKINLVYSINEPAAFGAATALKAAGRGPKDVTIVSIDGGCDAIKRGIDTGVIAATSQQYPDVMAAEGVKAIAAAAKGGKKPSGFVDTGVNLITASPEKGVPSKDATFGTKNCWG